MWLSLPFLPAIGPPHCAHRAKRHKKRRSTSFFSFAARALFSREEKQRRLLRLRHAVPCPCPARLHAKLAKWGAAAQRKPCLVPREGRKRMPLPAGASKLARAQSARVQKAPASKRHGSARKQGLKKAAFARLRRQSALTTTKGACGAFTAIKIARLSVPSSSVPRSGHDPTGAQPVPRDFG